MNANPLTTVGLMLTLAGLVGTFFNIQLSQWLRDLVALETKVRLNKAQGNESQQKAIVESQIDIEKLSDVKTISVNCLVLGFVVFVLADGLFMIDSARADPIYVNVLIALIVFLIFFVVVSGWLIISGLRVIARTRKAFLSTP